MKKKLKKILVLAGLISIPAYINKLIFDSVKNKVNRKTENFYNWRFGKIRYVEYGKGEPLLLIHNTVSGCGLYEWDKVIDSLSKNYKVYALDLIGYGYSDKPEITYSSYLYVSLINDFIKNVIKSSVNIVANGNSSNFALMLNSFNPKLINKIILISPEGIERNIYPTKHDRFKKFILELPIFGTLYYNIINSKLFYKLFIDKYIESPESIDEKLIDKFYNGAHLQGYSSKLSNAAYMSNYLNLDTVEQLVKINKPIHIVWGENDEINPINKFNKIAEVCPSITLSTFESTKSMPHIENPKGFYKVCRIFFKDSVMQN